VWKLAEDDYQKALEFAPQSSFLEFALGSAFLESGDSAAAEAFRKSLAAAPAAPWAKLRLALALAKEEKFSDAAAVCKSVAPQELELPDEFLDALRCASLAGQAGGEQTVLALARKRFPDSPQLARWGEDAPTPADAAQLIALTGPGLAFRFLLTAEPESGNFVKKAFPTVAKYRQFRNAFVHGDAVGAGVVASSLLEPIPSDPSVALALGEMLQCLSLQYYEHLRTNPDSVPAMTLAAENYEAAGEQEKALEIYQAMLRQQGPSSQLLYRLARVYWTEHRWDEALKVLESMASLDPNDATIFVNMGRIYSYTQDELKAEENFQRAVELDPKMFEAHLGLGQTLHRKGNLEGAIHELQIAATLNPRYARTHYQLAQIYRTLGKSKLAAREMADFTRLQAQTAAQNARRGRQLVPLD
jgi:tetratricopeptide (TPR) repeat protein